MSGGNAQKPRPRPWRVHHDEDVWILDATGEKIVVNVFDLEMAKLIVSAVNNAPNSSRC
jgi:hypothetical protein